MKQGRLKGLQDKYLPPVFLVALLICSLFANGQALYNPTTGTVSNKPYSPAQAVPTDSRSYKYDSINFIWRPYQNTAEVLSYLSPVKYRWGNFIIVVDSGGTLQSNGTFTNPHNTYYMFADSTTNAGLVKLNLFGTIGCSGCLLAANNLSDVLNAGTARSNLGLGTMATEFITASSTDVTGTWPNGLVVNSIQGHNLTYLQNYSNLTNTPPLVSLTTTGTSGVATYNSGTGVLNIPNYSVGGGGSCLNCNADTIGNIPLNFTSFCNNCVLTLDSAAGYAYWAPVAGGIPVIPPNIGTGFRVYAPQVPGFRTLICNSGCTIDSTTNTNALTFNITGGGSGTVTAFTAGNLSPIFTTSVANGTTTPNLTFTLSNAPAFNVLMNNTGSPAAPVYAAPTATILNTWFGGTIQPVISLTTTGTTGTATFISNTLNIPNYQGALTLTTTGSSGAATLIGNTLNIPNYLGGVTGVSNSDGTLTISPTTGAVVASLALGHANTWSALQTFGTLTTTGVTKFTGIASGSANDSILTINPSTGQITWRTGQPYPLYAVQGLSPIGTHGDSLALGGVLGTLFQPDTLFLAFNHFYMVNMLGKSTVAGTDSVLIKTASGELMGVPTSAIGGGGGGVSIVGTFSGSSLTNGASISGSTITFGPADATNPGMVIPSGAQTLGATLTLPNLITVNGGAAFGSSITFTGTTATYTIGDLTHIAQGIFTRKTSSDGDLSLSAGSGAKVRLQNNGSDGFDLLSTGQGQLNKYVTATTFTGTPIALLATDASGNIIQTSLSGGGGVATDSVSTDTTSVNLTYTQPSGANIVVINPSSIISSLTVTTATSFHNSNDLYIQFGGSSISSGPVVNALYMVAGSGLTFVQSVNPNGSTYSAGDYLWFHRVGNFLYRRH